MEIDFDSPKQQPRQYRTTARRLVTLAAVAALTIGGAAACASTTASAKPSGTVGGPNATPSASGSPSIQPGGPIIRVPSPSATGSPSTPVPAPTKQVFKGTGYTSNGDELTVYFYAGICEKYGLQANQSTAGEVLVTIVVTQPEKTGMACPMLVRQQQVSTNLGSPLDGRRVVDSDTGKDLPQLDAPTGTQHYSPGPVKIGG